MTFLYPLAFLVLLAIPVLIVIYIIRNKYKEGTVASTYLWEISQKFLKKRNPLNKFEHLLALLIQCLTIFALAVCLAHPQITLKGQADNMTFVLDTSASMQIIDGESTRFEKAKQKIKKIVEDSKDGSQYTLILAGSESKTSCVGVTDKSRFELYLEAATVSDLASDLEESMNTAQKYLSDGTCNKVYLATDKKFSENALDNVELIDVSSDGVNYSVYNVEYTYNSSKKTVEVTGNVYGYGFTVPENIVNSTNDEERSEYKVNVQFYVNDEYSCYTKVFVQNDVANKFDVTLPNEIASEDSIKSITVKVNKDDVLEKDNSYTVYNNDKASNTNVLIVGDANNYILGFFKANSNTTYKNIKTSQYTGKEGYDITIFCGYTPTVMPSTGAAWFIGCSDTVEGSGFIAQNTYEVEGGDYLSYTDDSSLLYKELTNRIAKNQITISKYIRYSLIDDFTTILSYNNLPIVFAGKNSSGQRIVTIGFDLETSDIAMKYDFLRLLYNFTKYSNPKVLSNFDYVAGDKATLSLPDDIEKIVIKTPNGSEDTIEKGNDDYVEYALDSAGTYEIQTTYTSSSRSSENMKVYSSFATEEGNPIVTETKSYKLALKEDAKKGDAIYDSLLWVVIACAVLFATDWILYAHEQY